MKNAKEFSGRTLRPADSGVDHYGLTAGSHSPYGSVKAAIVNAYLASGYGGDTAECEVEAGGKKYKVLRRSEVTVFYNEAGDTLFDVTNERLEKEHQLMSAPLACTEKSDAGADEDIKERAVKKLEDELKTASDKSLTEAVIGYLIERCGEDRGLCEAVLQENKTWKKCSEYIYRQAESQVKGNTAVVKDDTVYEWAEDYFHMDDKAAEAGREKERKVDAAKAGAGKKQGASSGTKEEQPAEQVKPVPEADKKSVDTEAKADNTKPQKASKQKKPGWDMDGQLDMLSMMGL